MRKEQDTIGMSYEFIICPGETLAEILKDRGITQEELANRTGMTKEYIEALLDGENDISSSFAEKLEYVLGIEKEFWINLQANYDKELIEYNVRNGLYEK